MKAVSHSSPAPPESDTIAALLTEAQADLASRHVGTPRLDAEVLLSHILQTDRTSLYTRLQRPLSAAHKRQFTELIARRKQREPLAYITGSREFWSLEFRVDRHVLIPRPETEIVVHTALRLMTSLNAVVSLAVSSVGPVLMRELVHTGRIIQISRDIVRPFYQQRSEQALGWLRDALAGCDYHVHRPEGAFFLWLWVPGLRVTSEELYRRLKARGVYVLPGHYFFPGLTEKWPHRDQCIRISYSRSSDAVRAGIEIIGDEVKKVV